MRTQSTNPLVDFEAAIEKLGGVEETLRQLAELNRKISEITPDERAGIRQVEAPVLGDLVPPGEVLGLLASSPEQGLFELERLHAAPGMVGGPIGRIVTAAIHDERIAPETRARLLWRYNHVTRFRDAALSGAKGTLPFGLLDSVSGRRDYCARKRPGYETVRCSSRVFFKRIQTFSRFDWEKGRVKTQEVLKKAIDDDSPAEFMLALGLVGKKVDARLLTWLLGLWKTKILDWLIENDESAMEWLDPRRLLFHVCASFADNGISETVERIEGSHPGTVASCTDALGRNLLWYTLYNRLLTNGGGGVSRLTAVEDLMIGLGADPDAKTAWGVSWRQMKHAMAEDERGVSLFVNGERAGEKGYVVALPQGDGDEHHFRIVLNGTGLAMEWAFPKRRFHEVHHAYYRRNICAEDDKGEEAAIVFRRRNGANDEDQRMVFRRGPDRLFHFAESKILCTKAYR